jgi:hypothetical protein
MKAMTPPSMPPTCWPTCQYFPEVTEPQAQDATAQSATVRPGWWRILRVIIEAELLQPRTAHNRGRFLGPAGGDLRRVGVQSEP